MAWIVAEHIAAAVDPQTWRDNPFAVRDVRRDSRQGQPFKSILWLCVSLLTTGLILGLCLGAYINSEHGVPAGLGGDMGACLVIFVSGIQVWFVARAAQSRVERMLAREATLDGMVGLLMLPMTRFQLLLQTSAYPWLAAMRVALLMLPVYIFCVGINSLTWAELFALYTVFALVGFAIPMLRRPALSGHFGLPTVFQSDDDTTTAEVGGQLWGKLGRKGSVVGWLLMSVLGPMIVFIAFTILLVGGSSLFDPLRPYIPESILSLLSSSILSWPLMAARILITPFGWFGTAVIPLPFVFLGALLRRYLQAVRSSEFLSIGVYRDLGRVPSYLPRRRMELLLNMALALALAGYLWPWAVRDNGLAFLAVRPAQPDAGLQGFLFLALFVAVWWGMARASLLGGWLGLKGGDTPEETRRHVSWRSATLFLLTPFAACFGFYALCLTLAGSFALPAGSALMAYRMIAVGLAGMLLNFGARRLLGIGGLMGWALTLFAIQGPRVLRPLLFLSPTMGLLNLGNRSLLNMSAPGGPFGTPSHWTMWLFCIGGAGAAMALIAWLVALPKRRPLEDEEYDDEAPALDPTKMGREAFNDGALDRKRALQQIDSPLSLAVVGFLQRRTSNAVAIKEIRTRLRSRLSSRVVAGVFGLLLAGSLIVGLVWPNLAGLGSGISEAFYGPLTPDSGASILANIQGSFYIAMIFAAFFSGYGILPRVFGLDRRKSALGPLLITPMSAKSIVYGKAFGLLSTSAMGMWAMGVWTLALSLPLCALLRSPTPLLLWFPMMLTAIAVLSAVGMVMVTLACLFPNIHLVRFNGCLRLIVLYMLYQFVSIAAGLLMLFVAMAHWPWWVLWVASVGMCVVAVLLTLMISISGVEGMRTGDIDIKLAQPKS